VPVLSCRCTCPSFHPSGRARMSKHRVTPNDTERRAPSTLETGRLNQGVLRDLRTLGVRPRGRSGVPLLRVRLQPVRRGRGSATGPPRQGPSPLPGIRACSPEGWGTDLVSVPNPPAFVPGSLYPVAECQASATWKTATTRMSSSGSGRCLQPRGGRTSYGLVLPFHCLEAVRSMSVE
jgi:hypothetical protein